ncbi:Glycine/D-amino acid oxidase [Palleronia marisminoris]|uniref:Glycine oxidase n=1 Tax=Palleronia marisminoris TaxID=315423 RepID=A0A1Y5SJP3_9RHOB|nr:FAD-binding oxidoreductase [Palleronia marisminoris]SFG82574.1 Glycine/D-amino acid oxidase [Palleronia marisminoris]SLN40672.1 Glycine oxidase [Palleronia marisminoris]
MTSDVTIRGAGIYGLTVAWEMLRRGARVTVIDPAGPGAGASGNLVGAMAPHAPEAWSEIKALQFESLSAAPAFWAEVSQAGGGDPGYARTGRLQPIADAAALDRARERAGLSGTHWPGFAWEVVDAPSGWAPVSATGLVIRDTLTARVDPPRAVEALVRAIRAEGGAVVADAPERGPVIHATGAAGLAALSRTAGREVGRPIKGQAARLAFDAADLPQIFADGLHVVPHADGTVGIGSTSERDFDHDAPDSLLDDVIARARTMVPAIADAPVVARWAGMRPRARSRQPLVGAWPGRPGHFVANGAFKIGFGTHIAVAQLVADLVLEGHDTVPAPLRPG